MPDAPTAPLARAVAEIERHVAGDGWDQAPRLFALAPTADLLSREPALVDRLRVGGQEPSADQLTPIEQELPNQHLEDALFTIAWPSTVVGCAVALERIVLPPAAESGMPAAPAEAAAWLPVILIGPTSGSWSLCCATVRARRSYGCAGTTTTVTCSARLTWLPTSPTHWPPPSPIETGWRAITRRVGTSPGL
jgi:hypothetical protein